MRISVKNRAVARVVENTRPGLKCSSRRDMSDLPKTSARGNAMATSVAQQAYQCDQCGNPDIVAVPLLYQQGTRTFSGVFNRGVSQSVAAQTLSPPRTRRYAIRAFAWGMVVVLCLLWGCTALRAFLLDGTHSASLSSITVVTLLLCMGAIIGMFRSMRKIYRYNHDIYPELEAKWAHSFMCRRCGKLQSII